MNKHKADEMLRDYKWKIVSVQLTRKELEDAGANMTAQYGAEAGMPKALNKPGDPVFEEVRRRGKRWDKVRQYEADIKEFQERLSLITDEREAEVLHWMLEGKSYRWIGKHMGLSFSHIGRIRDSIIDTISRNKNKEANGTNDTNDTNETIEQ